MVDLFDFKPKPSSYAVMGNPVQHSLSPQIHGLFAQELGIDIEYDRIHVDTGGFAQATSHFAAHGGAGLNITLPYKVEAWQLCQHRGNALSERADIAQAVNTLVFSSNGIVDGDNTDGVGFIADLEHNLGFKLKDKRVLLIGAGGAVRGVIKPIIDCEPGSITIANRTVEKARALSMQFDGAIRAVALDRVGALSFDLVVNGTAASLGGELPGLSDAIIGPQTLAYDMMYHTQPTVFMKWTLANGANQARDGLGMLVEQAAESFYIWHGQRPSTGPVIEAIRKQ